MDLITTALITALTAASSGREQPEIRQAYEAFKETLYQKFDPEGELAVAITNLEKKPDSAGRQKVLQEEVAAVKVDQDPEILSAAQALLEQVNILLRPFPQPLERPPRNDPFLDRSEELARLLANLRSGGVIALCGPGGIGKSALVAEAVWQLAPANTPPELFPDGIIYYNFRNQSRTDIALEQIGRIFGESPTPSPYDAAERALAKRRALLVIDGVDQADDLAGVLAVKGGCTILLSSRDCRDAGIETLDLGPLPENEAVELLQLWGGWQVKTGPPVQRVCELLGRTPLAIRLAGHYMIKQSVSPAQFLTWLETTPLVDMDSIQRQTKSVPILLERSLSQVSETAQQTLAVASLMALAPFDQAIAIEALTTGANPGLLSTMRKIFNQQAEERAPNVSLAIRELVDYGLLEMVVGKRYQISHPLIHTYAQEHLAVPAQTTKRLATFFVSHVWEQSRLGPEGYTLLEIDQPHLMALLTACLEAEDWEAAYSLATAVEDYLDRRGYWTERVIANEAGLIAAWQLRRPSEGAWLGNLGDAYRTMGHTEWAIKHFEKALAIARQSGNKHSEGNSLGNLGLAYRDLGQVEQAKSYLQQALTIFEKINSPSAELVRDWLNELEEELPDNKRPDQ